jgi:hypothetical protein
MAFTQPGAGDEHHIRFLLHKVQVKQVLNEHVIDLSGPVPVKLIQL